MNDNRKELEIDSESEPWQCDACGNDVSFEDKTCPKCGADISEIANDEEDISYGSKSWECDACGADVSFEDRTCPKCGADITEIADDEAASSPPTSRRAFVKRYIDLYRAARLLVGVGTTVKGVGIVLAIIIFLFWFLGGILASTQTQHTSPFGPSPTGQSGANTFFIFGGFVMGAVLGALVGGVFLLLGILISAQGQILLAQADAAIHTSPFLTEEEKAMAMSLPYSRAAEQVVAGEPR
jgi:Zn finger protein HypA/HybF involved in hydrogenase expression